MKQIKSHDNFESTRRGCRITIPIQQEKAFFCGLKKEKQTLKEMKGSDYFCSMCIYA